MWPPPQPRQPELVFFALLVALLLMLRSGVTSRFGTFAMAKAEETTTVCGQLPSATSPALLDLNCAPLFFARRRGRISVHRGAVLCLRQAADAWWDLSKNREGQGVSPAVSARPSERSPPAGTASARAGGGGLSPAASSIEDAGRGRRPGEGLRVRNTDYAAVGYTVVTPGEIGMYDRGLTAPSTARSGPIAEKDRCMLARSRFTRLPKA
jgi:hypothetical protein